MTKKEIKVLSKLQARNYELTDYFKENGNKEVANEYISERVAINRAMYSIGYEWNYAKSEFEKVVEND